MMSSKRILILLSAVFMISIASFFTVFITAAPDSLTVRVSDIYTGNNITTSPTANVTLWNCTNPGEMLASNTTADGQAFFDLSPGVWNVSIQVNVS